jgi:hypothetical protein
MLGGPTVKQLWAGLLGRQGIRCHRPRSLAAGMENPRLALSQFVTRTKLTWRSRSCHPWPVGGVTADRIMTLLLEMTPALCAGCLVRAVARPADRVRQAVTDLVAEGILAQRMGKCPVCQAQQPVVRARKS